VYLLQNAQGLVGEIFIAPYVTVYSAPFGSSVVQGLDNEGHGFSLAGAPLREGSIVTCYYLRKFSLCGSVILRIKNMVCDRCNIVVKSLLDEMNWPSHSVRLGEVEMGEFSPSDDALAEFERKLDAVGFELISDRKSQLISDIRQALIEAVHSDQPQKVLLSSYLSTRLHHDYEHLSSLFSAVEGITIEQFYILQKIERAKELLVYDELTLTEISHRLGYSSVSHLSRQFKQITGLTPTAFKKLQDTGLRRAIDTL